MESEREVFLGMPAVLVSPAIRQVIDAVRRVARSPVAVLITGETGSGKEIVARAIHSFSLRCARPWVDINCGALPEQLMESELFGHEKGAFSGADSAHPGLFEVANGGSLFLDEVAELDARMQVKLLRVLDGAPYYRVGGARKVAVDVRIIAATNQDLERRMATGLFRADLYHRLNQYRIRVPPLRERPEDIVPLAEYFLGQYSEKAALAAEAQAALRRYSWPGNVRELRNTVAHAVIAACSYVIGAEDLPLPGIPPPKSIERAERPLEMPRPAVASDSLAEGPLRLEGLEREAIRRALTHTGGHQQKAANLLGISRRTLSRKLRLYRLETEESAHAV